uniref:Stress up-regulated Nod 19 protein n=1 Tax=Leersia perrieri TaxID=77586 RepID=A0A0D9XA91_9ORYZ
MMRMATFIVLLVALLSTIAPLPLEALNVRGHLLKSKTFLSPAFFLRPGSVSNKFYYDVPFPRGHLAFKSFNAEVVDENGVPVPLHETYLHHWVVEPYYALKNSTSADKQKLPKRIIARNSGVCKNTLGQYYGLGSETRHTATWVPDPYGIEIGNPAKPPEGYEEKWLINVHAIDTRGAIDKIGCTECKCDLYNITIDEYGRKIPKDYIGGLFCCYDETQCKVREGFNGELRKLFLRYTVTWLDWSDAVVPVKIYIFDVTDTSLPDGKSESACMVEYQVEECSPGNRAKNECIDVKVTKQMLPRGGDVVFGVAHQHSGGLGASIHGQDGRLLCASIPTYGNGEEAGNEENYIVGLSTCYPRPGSVKVSDGEVLTVVSNYSSDRQHTGVMGLLYILVAEQEQPAPKPALCFSFPVPWCLPSWLTNNM